MPGKVLPTSPDVKDVLRPVEMSAAELRKKLDQALKRPANATDKKNAKNGGAQADKVFQTHVEKNSNNLAEATLIMLQALLSTVDFMDDVASKCLEFIRTLLEPPRQVVREMAGTYLLKAVLYIGMQERAPLSRRKLAMEIVTMLLTGEKKTRDLMMSFGKDICENVFQNIYTCGDVELQQFFTQVLHQVAPKEKAERQKFANTLSIPKQFVDIGASNFFEAKFQYKRDESIPQVDQSESAEVEDSKQIEPKKRKESESAKKKKEAEFTKMKEMESAKTREVELAKKKEAESSKKKENDSVKRKAAMRTKNDDLKKTKLKKPSADFDANASEVEEPPKKRSKRKVNYAEDSDEEMGQPEEPLQPHSKRSGKPKEKEKHEQTKKRETKFVLDDYKMEEEEKVPMVSEKIKTPKNTSRKEEFYTQLAQLSKSKSIPSKPPSACPTPQKPISTSEMQPDFESDLVKALKSASTRPTPQKPTPTKERKSDSDMELVKFGGRSSRGESGSKRKRVENEDDEVGLEDESEDKPSSKSRKTSAKESLAKLFKSAENTTTRFERPSSPVSDGYDYGDYGVYSSPPKVVDRSFKKRATTKPNLLSSGSFELSDVPDFLRSFFDCMEKVVTKSLMQKANRAYELAQSSSQETLNPKTIGSFLSPIIEKMKDAQNEAEQFDLGRLKAANTRFEKASNKALEVLCNVSITDLFD
ncbi:hypothetical protein HDV05_001154 [Chytridiales sp. JEL 0842]|nr:hypothetical protein HDV05_001154 [Chytridiales sp. JEL 0842]